MPYFNISSSTTVPQDFTDGVTIIRDGDDAPILQACVSETYKRRVVLSVNIPTAAPIILGLSALDAAWLGTQLLQLATIADDRADKEES